MIDHQTKITDEPGRLIIRTSFTDRTAKHKAAFRFYFLSAMIIAGWMRPDDLQSGVVAVFVAAAIGTLGAAWERWE